MKTIKIELPVYWGSYLVNGDASGLSSEEINRIDEYSREFGNCMDVSENVDFKQFRGLGCEVAEFTFIQYPVTGGIKSFIRNHFSWIHLILWLPSVIAYVVTGMMK